MSRRGESNDKLNATRSFRAKTGAWSGDRMNLFEGTPSTHAQSSSWARDSCIARHPSMGVKR